MTREDVLAVLSRVQDPDLKRDLVSLGMIEDLEVGEGRISFAIVLTTPACPMKSVMEEDARAKLGAAFPELREVRIRFTSRTLGDDRVGERLPIRNVLAVASGKGGVGKSSVTVNLAAALVGRGAKVGLLDADIYGPNIPIMLGEGVSPEIAETSRAENGKEVHRLTPARAHGIAAMSIGYLVPESQALSWRGPMLHSALRQLLFDTVWPELDYLLIDMPPGTGDVQLSIPQLCPVTAAIVVSSPQKVALADTRRGISTFEQLKVPILGLIENMGGDVFGLGGGEAAARELGIPFLGRILLDESIRVAGDSGTPVVLSDPEGPSARQFQEIAGKVASRLAVRLSLQAGDRACGALGRID